MNPSYARMIADVLALCLVIYFLLILKGVVKTGKKFEFVEKNKGKFEIGAYIVIAFLLYEIITILTGR